MHRAVSRCPNPHNDMRNRVLMTRSLNLCKKISEAGKRSGSQLLIADFTAHVPRLSADTSPEVEGGSSRSRGLGGQMLLH